MNADFARFESVGELVHLQSFNTAPSNIMGARSPTSKVLGIDQDDPDPLNLIDRNTTYGNKDRMGRKFSLDRIDEAENDDSNNSPSIFRHLTRKESYEIEDRDELDRSNEEGSTAPIRIRSGRHNTILTIKSQLTD